jgi:hypothetical protein
LQKPPLFKIQCNREQIRSVPKAELYKIQFTLSREEERIALQSDSSDRGENFFLLLDLYKSKC